MKKKTQIEKAKAWPINILFNWDKDRLALTIHDGKRALFVGWALQGSLNEIAKMTQVGHMSMNYALLTPAQARRWGKTGKPPRGYPT